MAKKRFIFNHKYVFMMLCILSFVLINGGATEVIAKGISEKTSEGHVEKNVKDLPEPLQSEEDDREEEIRARVVKKGVLGIISGEVKSNNSVSMDAFENSDFTSEIDAILQNLDELKTIESPVFSRKIPAGVDYDADYANIFTGNSESVEDIVGALMSSELSSLNLKTRKPLKFALPGHINGTALISGRSRINIMGVITQNLPSIRYTYGRRMKEKSELKGKVTVKFAIDEFGKVIFCSVVGSTVSDPTLEENIVKRVKQWAFEKINKVGDVTEVVYTFAFS